MIIVSACLLGFHCRYDLASCADQALIESLDLDGIIPICPEQLGGLPTPRRPATLEGGDGEAVLDGKARVVDDSGAEVTDNFLRGVEAVLKLVSMVGVDRAVLKEKSPSCGVHSTYVDGKIARGKGVLAAALSRALVQITSDKEMQ